MNVNFHKNFIKSYDKLTAKRKKAVDDKLDLFEINPCAYELNNHGLSGKYQGCRSINITGDYRAIYELISKDEVIFLLLGTHAQLYG